MTDIMNFSDFTEEPELEELSREELKTYLKTLRDRIKALDREEPSDMNSEAYRLDELGEQP